MLKNKLLFIVSTLIFVCQFAMSQNNTNSPYTLFGYGAVSDNYSGEQRAMGGVGIASHSKTSISTVNPASYSAVDTMTFMFDMGVSALGSRFSLNGTGDSRLNANLEYITMQFPLWKNTGFSMGVLPYSFTGYDYSTSQVYRAYPDTVTATKSFFGKGGISQVYAGLSVKLFQHLSLGVNAYYMFGNNINSRVSSFSESDLFASYQYDSIKVNSFRFRYGLQYNYLFNKKHDVTVGAFYEMKTGLNTDYTKTIGSVTQEIEQFDKSFEVPETYGVGLNYTYDKRITLAADYSMQKWGDIVFMGVADTLSNRSRFAIGTEFIPNPRSRKFFDRITYRLGFNLSDSYYKVDGATQPKNYGLSFGLGMPLRNNKSVVNFSFEYGKIGSNSLLREDYLKFTLNAVINENWFFKRKL